MAHDHSLTGHAHAHHAQEDGAHGHGIWTAGHVFLGHGHDRALARARLATIVTAVFMLVEVSCGLAYRSMALLADGVHMATHVGALGLAALAYWLARRHAGSGRFSFGSGKFGDLAAFASALALGATAIAVAVESVLRLITPQTVAYGDALLIAAIGLIVNLASAWILKDSHSHDHTHAGHAHSHAGSGHDNNMRAAYVHVLADAATSLLAILALAGAYYWGLGFLDPLSGLIGAAVIASWALGLIRDSSLVLLDADADPALSEKIRGLLEGEMGTRVSDLHLWRLGPGHQGLIVSLVSPLETSAETIKAALRARHPGLSHVTVEVAVCADCT
jgi:cation diffusion facilitator family transporter